MFRRGEKPLNQTSLAYHLEALFYTPLVCNTGSYYSIYTLLGPCPLTVSQNNPIIYPNSLIVSPGGAIMNIFGFNKPEPKGRRKTKSSSKWIKRVKTAAQSTPDFSQMADNPLLKAAVISRDNNFTLHISDFVGVGRKNLAFVEIDDCWC
jgi:hypothetical protein